MNYSLRLNFALFFVLSVGFAPLPEMKAQELPASEETWEFAPRREPLKPSASEKEEAERLILTWLTVPEDAPKGVLRERLESIQANPPLEVQRAFSVLGKAGTFGEFRKKTMISRMKALSLRLVNHPDAVSEDVGLGLSVFASVLLEPEISEEEVLRELEALPEAWQKELCWKVKLYRKIRISGRISLSDVQEFAEARLAAGGLLTAAEAFQLLEYCAGPAMLDPSILQMPSPAEARAFAETASKWEISGTFTAEERADFLANLELFVRACEWCAELRRTNELPEKEAWLQERREVLEELLDRTEGTLNQLADGKNLRFSGSLERLFLFVPPIVSTAFPERRAEFQKSCERAIGNAPLKEVPESQREESRKSILRNAFPPKPQKS